MRPDPEMIPVLIDTAKGLKGSQRRLFMAKTVKAMGRGGQRWAEEHLGWCRDTIRKGTHELDSGMTCVDAFSARSTTSGRSPTATARRTRSSRPGGSSPASVPPRSDAD